MKTVLHHHGCRDRAKPPADWQDRRASRRCFITRMNDTKKAPPDSALWRSPGSCEKISSVRLCSRLPTAQTTSGAPCEAPALDCFGTAPGEGSATTSCRPSPALPSAWPQVPLSSPALKISLPQPSLPEQPWQPASWLVQPWQPVSWQVLPSSLRVSPRLSLQASWPVPPWQPALPLPWRVPPSSLPVSPQLSLPASWPVLLLPWPPRPSAWQRVLLSSLQLRPLPSLLLRVLSLPVPWTPALWMTA